MMCKKTFIFFFVLIICGSCLAQAMRFAVVGDTQGTGGNIISEEQFGEIVNRVVTAKPAAQFVIQVGDLVKGTYDGEQLIADFLRWREVAAAWYQSDFIGSKVYLAPGNHDQYNAENCVAAWQSVFSDLPDNGPADQRYMSYSFDVGECHFTIVNTSRASAEENHSVDLEWLEMDLNNTDQPIIFVIGHEPAYPCGKNIGLSLDVKPDKRDAFWRILSEHNVKVYFCGHEHIYDHWIKDDVHQIISGSGGVQKNFATTTHYLIVDVDDENEVSVSVYNGQNGLLIEKYSLADTLSVGHEDRPGLRDYIYLMIDDLPCALLVVILGAIGFLGINLITIKVYKDE